MSNLATITNNILADSGIDDLNVIVSTGSYANPAWITSLAWTKITGAPASITGTIDTGQVAFGTALNTVGGSNNLFWDNANGRLGVNRTPTGIFDVNLVLTANQAGIWQGSTRRFYFQGDGIFWWGSNTDSGNSRAQLSWDTNLAFVNTPSGTDFSIRTGASDRIRAFSSGGVFIGPTPTDAGFRLDVNGTARVQGVLTTTADAVVNGVSVGRGAGNISSNTRVGEGALGLNTTGASNLAVGFLSLFANTTGVSNTAIGAYSLIRNTTGSENVSLGRSAGEKIADGTTNLTIINNSVFIGAQSRALADNQTNQIVIGHTAIGLGSNTTVIGNSSTTFGRWFGNLLIGTSTNSTFALDVVGTARVTGAATITADSSVNNVAIGRGGGAVISNTRLGNGALSANTSGSTNTALGGDALGSNTTGAQNTALGYFALTLNNGSLNTAIGRNALSSNTTGANNTAIGGNVMSSNSTGNGNTAIGNSAGRFIADGSTAITVSNNSIFLGASTRALADNETNQIVIGSSVTGLGSNTTVIGNSSTTFGRWFGNLLLGSSTNTGQQLQVTGTTLLNGLSTIQGTTASDTAPLGSELATTGTGTNWAGTDFATGYTHTIGSTAALTTTLAAVVSTFYQITYTVTGRTTGSFVINYGGTSTAALTATGAFGPRATSTATLEIVPTTDFNGTIVLSVRVITASSASVTFNSSGGTTTNQIRISNNANTFIGLNAGRTTTTGVNNTFVGSSSGVSNTTGNTNSFFGISAGRDNTIGSSNSFFGSSSGLLNTTGANNSFFGFQSGFNNTTGASNSFIGANAGLNNTTGALNSFFGQASGTANTTGGSNSFFGASSGFANTTGASNSFFGISAGQNNTTASFNSFFGENAGLANTTGSNNVAFGRNSGRWAGAGTTAMTSVSNSIYLGYQTRGLNATGTTNEIVIGYDVVGLGSNTTVLGNSSTTFGRWFGNLLIGTSTNNGTNLRVVGTTQSDIITQNLASHGKKVLQYGPTSSTTINLPTEFPLMTGLVVANTYAVFGKYVGKNLSYSQAIEFYISKNPNGFWNTVAYSNSSQFIANLVDVTGSGNDITITTSTNTSYILELTVMTQS
jgi:hypothetical protein